MDLIYIALKFGGEVYLGDAWGRKQTICKIVNCDCFYGYITFFTVFINILYIKTTEIVPDNCQIGSMLQMQSL